MRAAWNFSDAFVNPLQFQRGDTLLGLREDQKAKRKRRILNVAKARFQAEGYEAVTIEALAGEADLSAVTVYNYFGSKARILLALVEESDVLLIVQLEQLIASKPADLIEAVARFAQILRQHVVHYLTKSTWREVLSASIHQGSEEFGRTYMDLDRVLIKIMGSMIRGLMERRAVPAGVDVPTLADCLFSLQNIRFFQFVANDDLTDEEADALLRRDLSALRDAFAAR